MRIRHRITDPALKLISGFIFVCLIMIAAIPNAHAQDVIRLTNGEWKPFQSKELPDYGPYSKIVTEAFKRVGITVEYGFYPWKRAQLLAKAGKWDGTFFWVATQERKKDYLLSDVVFSTPEVIFYSKSFPLDPQSFEDFAGLTMGRIDGSAFGEQFNPLIKENRLHVVYAHDNEQLFKMMNRNRVDFIPELLKSGYDTVDSLPVSEGRDNFAHLDSFKYNWNYHLLISKKIEHGDYFIDAFNRGIKILEQDGTLERILAPLIKPERDN